MNKFNIIVDAIADLIFKLFTQIKILLMELYYKVCVLYKNKSAIDEKYDPIIQSKIKANSELANKLSAMNSENKLIEKNIENLKAENVKLNKKIKLLQDLLIQNHWP